MHRLNCTIAATLTLLAVYSPAQAADTPDLTLWYSQPADHWYKAVPLGNGRLGAMPFGGVRQERILCNEISLWSGWVENNDRPNSFPALQKMRRLIREGKREEARKVALKEFESTKGWSKPDFGAYQSFCDVMIDFDGIPEPVKNYHRDLDLATAIARVSFTAGKTSFLRQYFCSYPDQVSVMRFTSSDKGRITFRLGMTSEHKRCRMDARNNELVLDGQVSLKNRKREGMKFQARVIVLAEGGKVSENGGQIRVTHADAATVLFVGATNYKLEYPTYRGEEPGVRNAKTLAALKGKSYAQLRENHLADYQKLFGRVSLALGGKSQTSLPTDVRLNRYKKSRDDRGLEALLFQFGRYLLIASSRAGSLPPNLLGLWNNTNRPPWCADYHLNINLQMCYWPAGPGNLDECVPSLVDYVADLSRPGAKTARIHYNSRGWVAHHCCNVWGYTSPGPNIGVGVHTMEAESGAFICQNIWDNYAFTRDKEWLRKTGWPLMKGAAEFWVDNLQVMPNGHLAASPAWSPEHGPLTQGAYWQVMIVHDLFTNCIRAGAVLKTDAEFCAQLKKLRARLLPLKIGKFGQLCEWMDDDLEKDVRKNRHRHVSHLFSVYPGNQIDPDTTPQLAKAARQSLEYRGDGGTGWSTAWKINLWAHLHDGNRAFKLITRHVALETLPNLWDNCPPFIIDGNFGYTSGVCEMLLQSSDPDPAATDPEAMPILRLLPALPDAWRNGSVRGLRARGNLTVDMNWTAGKVTRYRIASPHPKQVKVWVNGQLRTVRTEQL